MQASPYAVRPTLRSTRTGRVLRGLLTEHGVIVGTIAAHPTERYSVAWRSTQARARLAAFVDSIGEGDAVESIVSATC